MNNPLLINCFPIRVTEDNPLIYWSETEFDGLIKTSKSKLTDNNKDRAIPIYWSPNEFHGANCDEVDATTNLSLYRDYLNEELHQHVKNLSIPYRKTFLGGSEVWICDTTNLTVNESVHQAFTMRILSFRDQHVTDGWTILIAYQGERTTQHKSHGGTKIPDELITTFLFNNQIHQSSKWSNNGELPSNIDVLTNRNIANFLNQQRPYHKDQNKYLTHFNKISSFYNSQLKGQQIGEFIEVLESGMGQVFESKIKRSSSRSNVLEFRGNRTHFNAYMGLKEYGPVTGPNVNSYKIFFIFSENNKDDANRLYLYFNRGFKGYPGLKLFVNVDLNLEKEKTIIFKNSKSPHREIEDQLSSLTFDEGVTYLAIYISPIKRDDTDDEKRKEYFLVKKALLKRGINSQVIFSENINEFNFHFFLPNISIAILAKLNGTPWRLSRQVKDELVIGIGAYRQEEEKLLGTTFTFRNDGKFVGFDAIDCNAVDDLSNFFEDTIRKFVSYSDEKLSTVKRVVIHFYKKMNNQEERQLTDALERLKLQVPYFVLNITGVNTYDYLVFDDAFKGKMPQSGTYIKIRKGVYLLCNNTRYKEKTGVKIDDFPFPLKVSISRSNLELLNEETIGELIDQVYQFSRMYWRSVKQKSMPVTILYSEIIAKLTANLPEKKLPSSDVAKQTLWFL